MAIKLTDYVCFEISHRDAPTFLRILKQNVDKLVIKEAQEFKINPLLISEWGEHITLIVKEYPTETTTEKETHHMGENVGVYKSLRNRSGWSILINEFIDLHLETITK